MESWGWITAVAAIAAAVYFTSRRAEFVEEKEAPTQFRAPEAVPEEAEAPEAPEAPAEAGAPPRHHVVLEDVEDEEVGEDAEIDPAAALARAQAEQEPQRPNKWKTREVGTKKAKSLARKEQRRQWFEYVRERAGEERERERLEREMFGDLLADEQAERRQRIEEAQAALDARRREQRARDEELRAERHRRRAELEQTLQQHGIARLTSDDDLVLAADLGHVVADGSYVVTVTDALVDKIAAEISGRTDFSDLASSLQL